MWCVGSVFASPQLRERSDLGPLLFDSVGEPQELLSTGCNLRLFDDPIAPPDKQTHYLAEDASINYMPDSIVHELVREDTAAKIAVIHDSNSIFGNRLECIECQDGMIQLMFPVGENFNSIGSILCERNPSGCWIPLKKSNDEPNLEWLNGVRMSISPTLNHPIRQISALKISNSNVDEIILVARTQYQVHVLNVQREGDRVCFASHSVTTYRKGVSHVVWSPFIEGELAAVLETGEVFVYNVKSSKTSTDNLIPSFVINARMVETGVVDVPGGERFPKVLKAEIYNLRRSWWRVEYGWHPKMLVVANAEDVVLHDSRRSKFQAEDSITVLATAEGSRQYCIRKRSKQDRFVAIARPEDGGYHFAVATLDHIILFDIRRPRTPLIQWEHSMDDDYPGHLSMHPLSRLLPHRDCDDGRVILAASFRTGDVRVFCYGGQPSTDTSSFKFRDLQEGYCAWHLPSKISTCRPRKFSLAGVCESLSSQPQDNFIESLSGIRLLPGTKTGFSLLQLTGSGNILNQIYASSKTFKRESAFSELPRGIASKNKSKRVLKHRPLPAMLNYVKHGDACPAILADLHQKKKLKATMVDTVDQYRDRIYKVLSEAESFLSTYEISFKTLLLGLPENRSQQAAKMPSNVTGVVEVTDRTPYYLPSSRYLYMQETPVPIPLPVLLEVESKMNNNKKESFESACDAVETLISNLKIRQQEQIVSLDSAEDRSSSLSQQLLFHSRQLSNEDSASSSSNRGGKFQQFAGSQELLGAKVGESKIFRRITPDDCGESAFEPLEQLQNDFQKWQQSFAPYQAYCSEKNL